MIDVANWMEERENSASGREIFIFVFFDKTVRWFMALQDEGRIKIER